MIRARRARIVATLVYLLSMFLTLFCAFKVTHIAR